jgi:hypothetical protein
MKKGVRKFLDILNSKIVIGAFIFIFLSLATIFAGNVVIKEGSLNASDRIYDKTGFVTPVGSINAYGSSTAPAGWLLCDGKNYSRTDYSDLYAIIGTTYGSNSANDFKVPNISSSNYINSSSGSSGFGSSLDNGSVVVWKFDENTGTNTVESKYGILNGTLTSNNWTSGKQGSAEKGLVDFSTSNTYDQIFSNTTTNYTIDFWINDTNGIDSTVFLGRGADPNFWAILTPSSNVNLALWRKYSSDSTSSEVNFNNFFNSTDVGSNAPFIMVTIVVTGRNDNQVNVYKNGVNQSVPQYADNGLVNDLTLTSYDVWIGRGQVVGGVPWSQSIDELYIWNRTLSPSEISSLYNSGAGIFYSSASSSSSIPYVNYIIKT